MNLFLISDGRIDMKSVCITGYFATGSGAVYNLLQEYISIEDGGFSNYEHIFLYDVNGVFQTIDRILYGNSLYNSNAAINAFRKEMKKLYATDYNWFGGYKYICGKQFLEIIEQFILDITEYHIQREWYGIYENRKITLERLAKDSISFFLKKRSINRNFGTKIVFDKNNRGEFSFASEEKMQHATKRLIENYLKLLYRNTDKTIILNHMLSPQDAYRVPNYTPNDFKMIIVDRDIRDLYVCNKYTDIWGSSTFPTEINEFVRFMKGYRSTERKVEDKRILRVQFEDLIYKYEETVKKIEHFVGINEIEHSHKRKIFIPEKSIKNTQVYKLDPKWRDEIFILEQKFPEFIYNFPCDNETSLDCLFDA